jgi:hypothetical protein
LDPLQAFIVLVGMNREHFSIGGEAFGTLHLLALVFIIGRRERSALLKREFLGCGNESWWT